MYPSAARSLRVRPYPHPQNRMRAFRSIDRFSQGSFLGCCRSRRAAAGRSGRFNRMWHDGCGGRAGKAEVLTGQRRARGEGRTADRHRGRQRPPGAEDHADPGLATTRTSGSPSPPAIVRTPTATNRKKLTLPWRAVLGWTIARTGCAMTEVRRQRDAAASWTAANDRSDPNRYRRHQRWN